MREVAEVVPVERSGPRQMMAKTLSCIAAVSIVVAACTGAGTEEGSSISETTRTVAPTEATAPTVTSTTTISATTSIAPVTTVVATSTTSTTSSSTTTEPPSEMNPPDVEAWWCGALREAGARNPADFAQGLADDFRHGYTDMPADTLEEAAGQAALVVCDPEYGRAVADALRG